MSTPLIEATVSFLNTMVTESTDYSKHMYPNTKENNSVSAKVAAHAGNHPGNNEYVGQHGDHHVYREVKSDHDYNYHVHNAKTGQTHTVKMKYHWNKDASHSAIAKKVGSHGTEHVSGIIHKAHNDIQHDSEYRPEPD